MADAGYLRILFLLFIDGEPCVKLHYAEGWTATVKLDRSPRELPCDLPGLQEADAFMVLHYPLGGTLTPSGEAPLLPIQQAQVMQLRYHRGVLYTLDTYRAEPPYIRPGDALKVLSCWNTEQSDGREEEAAGFRLASDMMSTKESDTMEEQSQAATPELHRLAECVAGNAGQPGKQAIRVTVEGDYVHLWRQSGACRVLIGRILLDEWEALRASMGRK